MLQDSRSLSIAITDDDSETISVLDVRKLNKEIQNTSESHSDTLKAKRKRVGRPRGNQYGRLDKKQKLSNKNLKEETMAMNKAEKRRCLGQCKTWDPNGHNYWDCDKCEVTFYICFLKNCPCLGAGVMIQSEHFEKTFAHQIPGHNVSRKVFSNRISCSCDHVRESFRQNNGGHRLKKMYKNEKIESGEGKDFEEGNAKYEAQKPALKMLALNLKRIAISDPVQSSIENPRYIIDLANTKLESQQRLPRLPSVEQTTTIPSDGSNDDMKQNADILPINLSIIRIDDIDEEAMKYFANEFIFTDDMQFFSMNQSQFKDNLRAND